MTIQTLPDAAFSTALLDWYDKRLHQMPWRDSRDPYRIWLSEIMLQQTRISTAEPYYLRFLERFPTIESLACASLDDVLKLWEGLGYYTRARNLHRLARQVVNEFGGQFPASAEALQQLPGIGRYTAAAIASIAFGERAAVLDGNVIRVLTRLTDLAEKIGSPRVEQQLWSLADALLPAERPGDYNQALMDFGRTICVPRRPACEGCPVNSFCLANARRTQHLRPVKKAKVAAPLVRAAAAVIRDDCQRLLLVERPADGLLGGLWMLPGGHCETNESHTDCLQRILKEMLNLEIQVGQEMAAASQELTHFRLSLRAFACQIMKGTPHSELRLVWADKTELQNLSLGKADRDLVESLDCWQPRLFEET